MDDEIPVDAFWKSVDSSQVMDSKLRVMFLNASGEPLDSSQAINSPVTVDNTTLTSFPDSFITSPNKSFVKDSLVAFNPTSGGDSGDVPQQQAPNRAVCRLLELENCLHVSLQPLGVIFS